MRHLVVLFLYSFAKTPQWLNLIHVTHVMLHDLFVCHSFFKSAFNFGEPQAETVWMGTPTIPFPLVARQKRKRYGWAPQPFTSVGRIGQLATLLRKLSDCGTAS